MKTTKKARVGFQTPHLCFKFHFSSLHYSQANLVPRAFSLTWGRGGKSPVPKEKAYLKRGCTQANRLLEETTSNQKTHGRQRQLTILLQRIQIKYYAVYIHGYISPTSNRICSFATKTTLKKLEHFSLSPFEKNGPNLFLIGLFSSKISLTDWI